MSSQKAPPAFQLYTKDFDTDENVMLMTCEQEGAYFRLLRVHWREGSIPADLDDLAALIRVQPQRLRAAIWPRVSRCFTADGAPDGRLVNPRMARDRASLDAFRGERSATGKRGAKARWSDGSGNGSAMAQPSGSDGSAIKQPMATDGSPFSILQSPITEPPYPPGRNGTASPPVEVHGNGNGHGTLRPKGLGAATERELERLLSDARVAALVDAWARDRGRTNREIGVARAATAALAGGYLPEQLALVSRLVALAGRQPERFPDRGSIRWTAQTKPGASYVWRSDALDKLIPECEAWDRA